MGRLFAGFSAIVGVSLLLACGGIFTGEGESGGTPGRDGSGGTNDLDVSISPRQPYVDGEVRCEADTDAAVDYAWTNLSTGESLGDGRTIQLRPSDVSPGDELRCVARAGNREGSARAEAGCGYADPDTALADLDLDLQIVFRPYITEDVEPGYGGDPWDWDGSVPDWLWDAIGIAQSVLDVLGAFWPEAAAASEIVDVVDQILGLVDQYAPDLMEGIVPPDPQVYPYLFDDEGELWSIVDGTEYDAWDNTYTIDLRLNNVDARGMLGLALDMEDADVAFNDNMGDYLDHDAAPLALSTELLADWAYCETPISNPEDGYLEGEGAYVPGSVVGLVFRAY